MRVLTGYTKKELCEALGVTRPTLEKRLEDPLSFTISEIDKLENIGIDRDILIQEIHSAEKR